jgi:hypothetical protein
MRRLSGVFLAVVLCGAISASASAQQDSWKNQWYWGAQAGTMIFSTATQSNELAFDFGFDWLITGDRVGLRLGFDQVLFANNTTGAVPDAASAGGLRVVTFSSMQRWQGELYGITGAGPLQVAMAGGFAIHHVTDAQATGSFASPQGEEALRRVVDDASSKAFFTIGGVVRWLFGDRWAAIGKYQYMPKGNDFLITSGQHTITAGISYALTVASEQITTER